MGAVESFLHGVKGFGDQSLLFADPGHGAPSVRFDEDLAFAVFAAANFVPVKVIGSEEPFSIPALPFEGLFHSLDMVRDAEGFLFPAQAAAQAGILSAVDHKKPGNHHRFGL